MEGREEYIAQLILKHSVEALTSSEKEVLDHWLSASEQNRDFFREITEWSDITDLIALEDRDEENNIQQKILAEIQRRIMEPEPVAVSLLQEQEPVTGRLRFPRIPRWYAAAALLVFIAGVAVWNARQKSQPPKNLFTAAPPESDRLPGSDRAILTLSNGQKVQLDPDAKEVIADGQVSINNDHGHLSYIGTNVATYNTITTPKGGQYHILLADGTDVWLNATSSIRYPTFFDGGAREVNITGEVYFDVQPDKTKPFIVSTPGGNKVQVLGTSFNINAYEDELHQVTTLVEGSIKILRQVENVVLQAGQQAVITNVGTPSGESPGVLIKTADVNEAIAWRNNLFVFNKTDLVTIMRQLGRWYDFEVRFEGPIPEKKFQGKMPRDIPLSQVLSALKMVGVSFELKGKELVVLTQDG